MLLGSFLHSPFVPIAVAGALLYGIMDPAGALGIPACDGIHTNRFELTSAEGEKKPPKGSKLLFNEQMIKMLLFLCLHVPIHIKQAGRRKDPITKLVGLIQPVLLDCANFGDFRSNAIL